MPTNNVHKPQTPVSRASALGMTWPNPHPNSEAHRAAEQVLLPYCHEQLLMTYHTVPMALP
jgi:hypothetical protein